MKSINKSRHLFLVVLFCIAIPASIFAGKNVKKTPHKTPLVLRTDTVTINLRHFDSKKLDAFTRDKEFQYNPADLPGQSLWTLFWRWVWDHLFKNIFGTSESDTFFYYLFLSLGVLFLIFIALKISGLNIIQIMRGDAKTTSLPYHELLENINEISFDVEIEKAIANSNYRLAVRLLYLSSLKQLNDVGLIKWQIEKTNSVYVNELPVGEKRQVFSTLTQRFEYIWYGDFHIDSNAFQNIRALFQQFKQTL